MRTWLISLFAAIALSSVIGCASQQTHFSQQDQQQIIQSSFADETYIWESFIFPKNKAETK